MNGCVEKSGDAPVFVVEIGFAAILAGESAAGTVTHRLRPEQIGHRAGIDGVFVPEQRPLGQHAQPGIEAPLKGLDAYLAHVRLAKRYVAILAPAPHLLAECTPLFARRSSRTEERRCHFAAKRLAGCRWRCRRQVECHAVKTGTAGWSVARATHSQRHFRVIRPGPFAQDRDALSGICRIEAEDAQAGARIENDRIRRRPGVDTLWPYLVQNGRRPRQCDPDP